MLLTLGIILLFYLIALALKKLWIILNLVLYTEYFRPYQRGLITVITGALIISVLSGAVKIGDEEIYKVEKLNGTIAAFTGSILKQTLDHVVEFSQLLILIDCASLALFSKVHSSTIYRYFSTFMIFFLITAITLFQGHPEFKLQILISMFCNVLVHSSAYLTTSSGVKDVKICFLAAPYLEVQQTTRTFMIFSISRLISRSIEYLQPDLCYLVFETLHVTEALIFAYALFTHKLPAVRQLRQEYDDVKAAFKRDFPKKMKIRFPIISLQNQDVQLCFGVLQENGKVEELDLKGPFNWKTTRVPLDFQEKFGIYLNPGTPPPSPVSEPYDPSSQPDPLGWHARQMADHREEAFYQFFDQNYFEFIGRDPRIFPDDLPPGQQNDDLHVQNPDIWRMGHHGMLEREPYDIDLPQQRLVYPPDLGDDELPDFEKLNNDFSRFNNLFREPRRSAPDHMNP